MKSFLLIVVQVFHFATCTVYCSIMY